MAQDHFAFHHPVPVQTGDKFGNVRKPVGGNVWYNVVDDARADASWDILNDETQDISWDILNDETQNFSWDILNDVTQDFSWDILNDLLQGTSWHIHPAIIEYIQQYLIGYLKTNFEIKKLTTGYAVKPITTNFNVTGEIDTSHKVKPLILGSFKIKYIQTSFAIREPLIYNYKAVPVNDNTRREFP
jgi:hypothetical protein